MAEGVVIKACPTAAGAGVPPPCENPDFDEFSVEELSVWVHNGYEFWGLLLVDDNVTLVEQWWEP
jgi:hypothetical protein